MKRLMRHLRRYFFTGLAVILPLALTLWILKLLFQKIDQWFLQPLLPYLKNYLSPVGLNIMGRILIIILFIFLFSFIGFLVNFLFFRRLLSRFEKLLLRFPFVGKIYKTIKQISMAIVGEGKNIFTKVALVEYPQEGRFCIGFLTREAEEVLNKVAGEKLVAVFIPTTPNPTSGLLIYFPKENVKLLDLTVEEGMRLVISAGTAQVRSDD